MHPFKGEGRQLHMFTCRSSGPPLLTPQQNTRRHMDDGDSRRSPPVLSAFSQPARSPSPDRQRRSPSPPPAPVARGRGRQRGRGTGRLPAWTPSPDRQRRSPSPPPAPVARGRGRQRGRRSPSLHSPRRSPSPSSEDELADDLSFMSVEDLAEQPHVLCRTMEKPSKCRTIVLEKFAN